MKFLLKYKRWILIFLFVAPLLLSLYVQYDENIKKYNYWNYQVLEKLNIATKEEINSLNSENAVAKFKDDKKEIIRKFLPSSEQYRDFSCYKKFNTNTDETMDIIINSLGILQFGKINDECFTNESKQRLFVSYLFIYFAIFFTIIILFIDKIRRLVPYKNHIAIIGLNRYSREIIKQISDKDNIKIYDNDSSNKYINELENSGEIIITGKLEYTIESNDYEIINAKEIFIINDSDAESLNNLALILSKFKHENRKIKDKTKIYIEIKNRENKAFFDKKGIYDELITDYYEIYPFSINEIIVQEMFKNKPLISNIKNKNGKYEENLKILIVGFNDLSEEILYNILKLGHFDLDKITEVTVIDDKYELLNSKYNKIIKRGKEPYENNNNKSLWKLEFLPYKCLYEERVYNRIILCDKELNNGIDIFNYINNNFHVVLEQNNTIIQIFNEHINIKPINIDNNNFKNFSTFGDIETTVTLDNIKNNNLYKVAEYTNDFKETDESKKWINIDSFTRESNITEKLHIDIKLHLFGLEFKKSNQKLETIDSVKNYIDKNKSLLKNNFIEAIKLPYVQDLLKNHQISDFDKFIKNNDNLIETAFACSLINFYCNIKDKTNHVEIIHRLAQIEHTRWNAYHILNGWRRKKNKTDDRKDMLKKEHFDLCDWETLHKEDFGNVKYDYKNIYQIPFVAYCLGLEIVEIKKENKDNLKNRKIECLKIKQ